MMPSFSRMLCLVKAQMTTYDVSIEVRKLEIGSME